MPKTQAPPPPTPPPPVDTILDTEGAASYVKVPAGQLKQLRVRGGGPVFSKLGRHVRYRRSDLDAWMDAGRVDPGGPVADEDRYARLRRGA